MVLMRHPKKYKHFIKILTSQLMIYENIMTTNAKAKHLRVSANKLIKYAKKAANGSTSANNLLKGRVSTDKVLNKLLLNLIPRLNHLKHGNFVKVSTIQYRRRGDNAPMVNVSIVGDEKSQFKKNQKEAMLANGSIVDIKSINKKWLLQQKTHYENLILEKPQMEQFLRQKINRIDFELWTQTKSFREPKRYTLLV